MVLHKKYLIFPLRLSFSMLLQPPKKFIKTDIKNIQQKLDLETTLPYSCSRLKRIKCYWHFRLIGWFLFCFRLSLSWLTNSTYLLVRTKVMKITNTCSTQCKYSRGNLVMPIFVFFVKTLLLLRFQRSDRDQMKDMKILHSMVLLDFWYSSLYLINK